MDGPAEKPRVREPAPPVTPRDDVRVVASPTRCPFCHDEVRPDANDWVACKACLGRHHATCWGEARACATCGATEHLEAPSEASRMARAALLKAELATLESTWITERERLSRFGKQPSRAKVWFGTAGLTVAWLVYTIPLSLAVYHRGPPPALLLFPAAIAIGIAVWNRRFLACANRYLQAEETYRSSRERIEADLRRLTGGPGGVPPA